VGLRIQAVIVHCLDPRRLAAFWAEALGWTVTVDDEQESVVEPQPGSREDCVVADLLFIRVAEPKQGQNRLHLDLRPDDQAAEVERLLALGASFADVGQGDDVSWQVMADPEGNEFCVLQAYPPDVRGRWQAQYDAYRPA
jgi:hypothetical protein